MYLNVDVTPGEFSDPRFDELLRSIGARWCRSDWLRRTTDTVVGLWPDLTIAYVNPSWFRFARDNGAQADFDARWTIGCNLLASIPEVLQAHYQASYDQCLQSGVPLDVDYECSTPDRFRVFRSTAYPLGGGQGLLVVHSLRIDRAHDRPVVEPAVERFIGQHGILVQCSYCRRFAEGLDDRRWLWVPDWVREPPAEVSHGICSPCLSYYFA